MTVSWRHLIEDRPTFVAHLKASRPAERYSGDEEFADARVRIPPTKGLLHGPDGVATYADRRLDQPQSIYRPDIAAG
jgi:hypothetical protein